MDDIGLLVKDMGVRPQGKAAPMSASQSASSLRSGVWGPADYADVFGGPSRTRAASPPSDFDSFFRPSAAKPPASSMPVYDRPVYDDDIFDGVPGVRSAAPANRASSPPIDDLLESVGRARKTESTKAPTPANRASSPPIDDLLESFGRARKTESTKATPPANRASSPPIDDLLESFGRARNTESTKAPAPPPANRASSPPIDDLLEGLRRARKAESTKAPAPPPANRASSPPIDDLLESLRRARKAESTKAPPPPPANRASSPPIDYLLESFGLPKKTESAKVAGERGSQEKSKGLGGFEELIPGFVGSSSPPQREPSETNHKQSAKSTANASDDPFVVLETSSTAAYSSSGLFTDPLEQISRPTNSENTRANASSVDEGVFDDANDFDRLRKSVPSSTTSEKDGKQRETGLPRNVQNASIGHSAGRESLQKSSVDPFENLKPQGLTTDDHLESNDILYEKPSKTSNSSTSFTKHGFQNSDVNVKMSERDATSDMFPRSVEADDVWLTIDEIPLVTQPTTCLPPSRPPPPIVDKQALTGKADHGASVGSDAKKYYNQSFWQSNQNHHVSEQVSDTMKKSGTSPIDELENFAVGKPQKYANEYAEEMETNSFAAASAAAMKEAMDRAEAKFRQAREVRERERGTKSAKLRDFEQQEGDAEEMLDGQDQVDQEMQERLEHERRQRERVEKEREEKRRERAREQELERERERAKEAVGRATREARDRAAAEARRKAERAAVDKVNADSRLRAERAVVQKIAAEARERAAAEARERAERAAAEAREKVVAEARAAARAQERAATEAREKAATEAREKAAAERAAADARSRAERAAAEAREKAAAAAREKQYKNENDLESFFGMDARASSAPRQRATSSETVFDAANRAGSDGMQKTSVGSSSTFRKASSANIVDDLTSIFGASPSSNEFQEVEGESEERRRARLERHQRTLERAAKALAEKNERDIQVQREQAERHRIAETLDIEIKRWAAGKEGNLRALLSTLQYVLWPECGWQPVSLTDLITAASVKKVYRKATLCIHPDKVQQKGANLQQKYTAEKVFDLLKEAWNKFNSEELF